MKIALGQINTTVGDIDGNVSKILKYAREASLQKTDVIIFPELAVCGYPPMDLLLKESFIQANLDGLEYIRKELNGITVIVGFVDRNEGPGRPLYNALAVIRNNKIQALQRKTLLPTYDVFDEDRYFESAKEHVIYSENSVRFGLSICEDIWNYKDLTPKARYQNDPIDAVAALGCDLLVNISASPFALGKQNIRHDLVRGQARAHKVPIIYVNAVGANTELVFDGRSIVVDAEGNLVAQAKAFEEDLIFVDIEPANKTAGGASGNTTNGAAKKSVWKLSGPIHKFSDEESANTYAALTLGLRDYMQKCGFSKAVIGLSGGIDSAVVCALAAAALGSENVIGVAMPSPHSSQHSIDDARKLAENLGIEFHIIPIEKAMVCFDEILAEPFEKSAGKDVTEENLQARIRGSILMAFSNKFGYLVLTTGNKSELAVGYCTLYGDMCGGLAVISDLPKMSVYALASHINTLNGKEVIPQNTIDKAPSAELRPGQMDQDTLPPYPVLDAIIHAYVERRLKPDEIVKLGYEPDLVLDVITRIDRNEYKRQQAAPGLKVTEKAFGVGWRMPIAQRFKEVIKESTVKTSSAK